MRVSAVCRKFKPRNPWIATITKAWRSRTNESLSHVPVCPVRRIVRIHCGNGNGVDPLRYLDNKRTKWPVDPALYPLSGPTKGEVYMPPEPTTARCGALCAILRAALVMLVLYALVIWYYTDAPNPWALLTGNW